MNLNLSDRTLKRIVFRADAGKILGSGHVMRCLVLADRLHQSGAEIFFICDDIDGNLSHLIERKGYHCELIDLHNRECHPDKQGNESNENSEPASSRWCQDAELSKIFIRTIGRVDLLVADHYGIDFRWQRELHSYTDYMVALDDLADRRHQVNMIIDQNYARVSSDYLNLANSGATLLTGSQYTLLRPEFALRRSQALLNREEVGVSRHLMISLGGGDNDDVLQSVLKKLGCSNPRNLSKVTVVGAANLDGQLLARALYEAHGTELVFFDYVEDMAALMSTVDLAIGGGGISGWERCSLGLPALVVLLSSNQEPANRKLAQDGCIFACLKPDELNSNILSRFIDMSTDKYLTISKLAANVADGRGVDRIMEILER